MRRVLVLLAAIVLTLFYCVLLFVAYSGTNLFPGFEIYIVIVAFFLPLVLVLLHDSIPQTAWYYRIQRMNIVLLILTALAAVAINYVVFIMIPGTVFIHAHFDPELGFLGNIFGWYLGTIVSFIILAFVGFDRKILLFFLFVLPLLFSIIKF